MADNNNTYLHCEDYDIRNKDPQKYIHSTWALIYLYIMIETFLLFTICSLWSQQIQALYESAVFALST